MLKKIPNDLIVFISGAPGAGKTTISYELLQNYDEFRIVEETDIMREVLRGYNEYLSNEFKEPLSNILPHNEWLSYQQAKEQCEIMKYSLKNIVERQKRKKIPTIINGVHIIPEVLYAFINVPNIIYITLYFDSQDALYRRIQKRDCQKYGKKSIPFLFETNTELYRQAQFLHLRNPNNFLSINISDLSIAETIKKIEEYFLIEHQ